MNKTKELFEQLYELYQGYNYIEYEDCILFDFVNKDDEYQTIRYNKGNDIIVSF